jgi:chaperonin GroEL
MHYTRQELQVEEGIVSGGGVALLQALPSLGKLKSTNADEQTGVQIRLKSN